MSDGTLSLAHGAPYLFGGLVGYTASTATGSCVRGIGAAMAVVALLGLAIGVSFARPVPDANTIWTFSEALTSATIEGEPAVAELFARFDAAVKACVYFAMGGQIVDARIVARVQAAQHPRGEAGDQGSCIPEGWANKPAKLARKDRDAHLVGKVHQGQAL